MPTIFTSTFNTNPVNIDSNIPMFTQPNLIQEILGQKEDTKDTVSNETLIKAKKIDSYFGSRNLPLNGQGLTMVLVSEKYGIDWRLLPALAMRETTGGKKACPVTYARTGDIGYTYNVFGWGSCKIRFDSYESAFETLARNLSGQNPNTASYYKGKDLVGMLESYNPRHVVATYPEQVIAIMNQIDKTSAKTNELALK